MSTRSPMRCTVPRPAIGRNWASPCSMDSSGKPIAKAAVVAANTLLRLCSPRTCISTVKCPRGVFTIARMPSAPWAIAPVTSAEVCRAKVMIFCAAATSSQMSLQGSSNGIMAVPLSVKPRKISPFSRAAAPTVFKNS